MSSKLEISKLKAYHFILLGCLLGILLVLNSNYVNQKKSKIQQDKNEQALFNRLISQRRLQDNSPPTGNFAEEEVYESDIICSYASDELQEYYNTSDLSKIDLDDGPIKCEDKDKDYMKTLIEIVKSLIDDDENEGEGNGDRRALRNLMESETKDNIKKYGKRLLPMLVFAVFSVLSIIGWIFCCFCCCCNCCCCCCCKKPNCRIPCLIFTYFFYAAVIAVSIYGFTQTSKIFTGLSNTECSSIRFFETILFGETRDENNNDPKWIGIEGVTGILNNLKEEITDMKESDLEEELELNVQEIDEKRDEFFTTLKSIHKRFYSLDPNDDIIEPQIGYYLDYTSGKQIVINSQTQQLQGKYVLDLIPAFGKYDDQQLEEEDKYTGLNRIWYKEISEIDRRAGGAIDDAKTSFNNMLGTNLQDIQDGLDTGSEKLDKLRNPLNDIYDSASGILYDVSQMTNDYGEKYVKYIFGALALMNAFLAFATLSLCLLSGQSCEHCCLCRCLCKMAAHLIWNILALCMIISFLVGSILALVGRVGGDAMSLVSYILSEENFNSNKPLVINKLGSGKDVLEECIVGDGVLSRVFDLDGITEDFDTIYRVKDEIVEYKQNFTNLAMDYRAYHRLKEYLVNRTEFIDDTIFKKFDNLPATSPIASEFKLSDIMKLLNDSIQSDGTLTERWNPYTGDKNFECYQGYESSGSPTNSRLHPWKCEPIYRGWVASTSNPDIQNYAQIVSEAIDILKYANKTKEHNNEDYQSYFDVLDYLKAEYTGYLNSFIHVLEFFEGITGRIISVLEAGIGNSGDTFSFLNGKFIKSNLKIILKYLKYSLGQDFYTVGICLVAIGFSLIFSISATILLIVIINIVIENNKKFSKDTDVPDFPITNDGRVVQFKY